MIKRLVGSKLVLVFIIIACVYRIYLGFESINFDLWFGYMDYQHFWNSWSNLANGGIIYKDFFWEYGVFYLFLGLPSFILLGKSFFACIFTMLIVMPIIGLFTSLILGRQVLAKFWLTLFIVLTLVYGINTYMVSVRHFLPELGILIFILGCESAKKYRIFTGSLLLGVSMFSSFEYGLASLLTLAFYLLLKFLTKKLQNIKFVLLNVLLVIIFLLSNLIILQKHQALTNYVQFFKEYISTFNYLSPCREVFPRFNAFTNRRDAVDNLVSLNLYIIPLSIGILFVWISLKFNSVHRKHIPFLLALLFYSGGVFFRGVSTPCFDYVSYGLTLYFLVLILINKYLPKSNISWYCCLLLIWFLVSGTYKFVYSLKLLPSPSKSASQKILPGAEVKLDSKLVDDYQEIVDFVKINSREDDYLFVYPNGPYNQLSNRKSPVSISSAWYYTLAPFLNQVTVDQLENKKTELIIMNTHNGYNILSSMNNFFYNLYRNNNEAVFDGVITPVEDYISKNYEIVKTNKVAWVLKRREHSKITQKKYIPKESSWAVEKNGFNMVSYDLNTTIRQYQVDKKQRRPLLLFSSEDINDLALIKIPIKVDVGALRPFSKFTIDVFYVYGNNIIPLTRQFVSSSWQDVWLYPYKRISYKVPIKIMITISDNYGLLPFGKPLSVSTKFPQGYLINPNIDYSTAAFKVQ